MFYKYILWSFSPVALFLLMGLALFLFGAVTGLWTIVQTLGPPVASAGSVLLSVAPTLIGIQMLMYALLLDIQESPDGPMMVVWDRHVQRSADGPAPEQTSSHDGGETTPREPSGES
jgi:hypothetical protein